MSTTPSSNKSSMNNITFETYPFQSDQAFLSGLESIKSQYKDKSKDELEKAIENAKRFYWVKVVQPKLQQQNSALRGEPQKTGGSTNTSSAESDNNAEAKVNMGEAERTKPVESEPPSTDSSEDQPSYPKTFQEVIELVTAGKPVPGIRHIPNILNTEEPSKSVLKPRPKPWEKNRESKDGQNAVIDSATASS
ncbi:hypothetical protein BKA69DRAFT_1122494 [Paraphysoderma sedebokerense]|nr:hypothetical protein BKA69DRAFT_1122494 [Paraphysoderma sedebokerense]